ncbi:MAG: hypothetical protein AB2A00_08645 [Myxococcota bacterium]
MRRSLSWLIPALVAFGGCPFCPLLVDPEVLGNQSRRVVVEVCSGGNFIDGKGGTDQCVMDVGAQDLSARVSREIKLHNVAEDPVKITGYEFSSASDPAFAVVHYPDVINPGVTSQLIVSFRPLLESTVEGDLILLTDAQNTNPSSEEPGDGKGRITIHMKGAGVNNGVPHLEVSVELGAEVSSCCDLGYVAKGNVATCPVRLKNTGQRGLVLEEVGFVAEATDGPWEPVGRQPVPNDPTDDEAFTIGPGESKIISFKFKPTDVLPHAARVRIKTNAPRVCGPVGQFADNMCSPLSYADPCPSEQVGIATVDLKGQGADPPVCVAKIKSVNGDSVFDPDLIEPLDDVELTAEDSYTSQPDLTVTGYKWTIVRKPVGSGVHFDNDASPTPRFVFDNTSTNIITGLDLVGEYEARCEVTDSRGTKSINDAQATVAFRATPSEAIHLQLVWDAPETDVDLHLVREFPVDSGSFEKNSDNDCYYANCKPTTDGPIWGSAETEAHKGPNPVLDVDDVQGYGPENSNINEPLPGKYKALVHYFSDHGNGDTVATLRVYLYGNLVAEYFRLISDGEWWDVGNVIWPGDAAPSWEEVDALQ